MSKIGKKPIEIPEKVSVKKSEDGVLLIEGPLGTLKVRPIEGTLVEVGDKFVAVSVENEKKQYRSNWGTLRSLIQNAVDGVTKGFEKTLLLEGVGYKVNKDGDGLLLALGFSHPVTYAPVPGIVFECEKNTLVKIKGIDKALVGQVASEIRAMKKPEPYKGKGFRYQGEIIRRKAGKKAGSV
ncbi:50S ribosomal protein L6 [Candidatus Jorgensenbacteria bacterium RIFCSPLOWO2_01_FULL_45_25b]|uniref:50S ribosomal protein L6 n=1 Tax=Candidatus Jorgensenbacteria bacterium RIFCSPLOWO2_01_FULL_45_25b TaxID=1798471 RepID=A0A1F6BV07_9BACT|nr:MAG: 50S ribosomal protein L6 [Candidatus Jorgensenbacteria bacterium RIFCSPLOWO2_01_FULL_45_25b]